MKAIQGIQLSKTYHHYQVLREVSFEIGEGECYVLFGPNGAGKTTLLKILATLQKPSLGRFEMMGYDGVKDKQKIRSIFLLLGHGSYLYNDLDAVENLTFSLALRGQSASEKEMKIALDRVGIGAFTAFKIRSFSEGMKKRLSIAKAMLSRPKILLLDEPYAALDEAGMKIMNDFIRESSRHGTGILMTSHNRVLSAEVAHRAGSLQRGVLRDLSLKELVDSNELL